MIDVPRDSVQFDVTDSETLVQAMAHSLGTFLDPKLTVAAFNVSMEQNGMDPKRAAEAVVGHLLPLLGQMANKTLPFDMSTAMGVVSSFVAWDLLSHCTAILGKTDQ
jgi:hypothetical protein